MQLRRVFVSWFGEKRSERGEGPFVDHDGGTVAGVVAGVAVPVFADCFVTIEEGAEGMN